MAVLAVKWPSESIWVAERIRLAMERLLVARDEGEGEPLSVSVSIGVSRCLPSEAGAPGCPDLATQAEKALEEAKRLGRNRVCHWDPETGSAVTVEPADRATG